MKVSAGMAMAGWSGLLSAALSLLYLLPIPGLAFFSYFAPLPLFLLGLSYGLKPLYKAIIIASLLVCLIGGFVSGGEFFLLSGLGPGFLVNRALLNRLNTSKEQSWYPGSFLLRDLTFCTGTLMFLLLGTYLYFTNGGDTQDFLNLLFKNIDAPDQRKEIEPLLRTVLPLLPGFFALSWALMMLINGTLAQLILVKYEKNLRPSPTLKSLEASKPLLILLGISFLLTIVGIGPLELIGKNLTFVLAFPFFLIGLGIAHGWLKKTSYPVLTLTLFYLLLVLFVWPMLFVTFLGVLKPWLIKHPSLNS